MALNYVDVTGTFDDGTGTGLNGTVTFTPSQTVYYSGIPVVSAAAPVVAEVIAGTLHSPTGGTLQLLATDNTSVTFESLTGWWNWSVEVNVGGTGQAWSFFLPHTPSTVDLYSTANTEAGGGGLFGGGTLTEYLAPAVVTLSFGANIAVNAALGNVYTVTLTSSAGTMKNPTNPVNGEHIVFEITQDATGHRTVAWDTAYSFGAGGAPALSTAAGATDVLGFIYSSGTSTWLYTGSAPINGTAAPWQFLPESYGAKGDGKVGTGGTGTSGTSAFSDSGASFTSADVGKYIIINQGAKGGNTLPFTGTIIAFTDSTHVTLSGNLGSNAANAPYFYGTDDAPAINACIAAAAAYAEANNEKAQVVFGPKFYALGTVTQATSPARYNTHLPLPYPASTSPKLVIELAGNGFSPAYQFWDTLAMPLNGTCLVSAITPSVFQPDATFGQFSVLGTPNNGVASGLGPFANTLYIVNGLTIVTPWGSTGVGMDGIYMSQMELVSAKATAFAPVNFSNGTQGGPNLTSSTYPTNGVAVGFRFPTWGNNAFSYVGYACVEGFSIGFDVGEHFSAQYLMCDYVDKCFQLNDPSQNPLNHGITVQHASFESCNHVIYVLNGSGGNQVPVYFDLLDVESVGTDQVFDPASCITGQLNINSFTGSHLTINGGSNAVIIDAGKFFPGPWSGAPVAPTSGGASSNTQQNTSYRYATIYCSASSAISNAWTGAPSVATGLTATGQAGGANVVLPVRVAPGAYFAVAYTGTLTTRWYLD